MSQSDTTETGEFRLFIAAQVVWLTLTVTVVTWFGITTSESQFVLVFLGWLSASVLFQPVETSPRWWRVSVWLTRGGFIVLGYFVYLRAQGLELV